MRGSVPVARRSIFADSRRLVTGVFGLGAAIALILLLQGLWSGVQVQVASYAEHSGAQLFVGSQGTLNSSDSSVIPDAALAQIRRVEGVERADPILLRWNILTVHDRRVFVSVVGFDPGRMGGPWKVVSGRSVTGDGEVVIDQILARQHNLRIGSTIELTGRQFRVVGLSGGTRTWMSAYVFMTRRAEGALTQASDTASFVLVKTKQPQVVARELAARDFSPLTVSELVRNDRKVYASALQGPFRLMIFIAFVAGTLIVALTVYSQIVERVREYGIVKAMGARALRLFRIVLGQTLILGSLGVATGLVLFVAGNRVITAWRPQFWIRLSAAEVLAVIGAAALMGLLASILPARRIARLDPATAYRG